MVKRKTLHSIFWVMLVIIGIGVMMGAIFPAGRDPFVPRSSAVAARGRNLYVMIEQNNIRHQVGETWCDPKMCSNSVEFITGVVNLIDAEAQHECVTDVGVTLWNVVIDVPEDYDESFPVLISSNFNPKSLERQYADSEILPIGRIEPLNDRGIVVVRKCGIAHVIKAKQCTRKVVAGNSITRNCQITYLTPEGRTTVDICCDHKPDAPGGPHGH